MTCNQPKPFYIPDIRKGLKQINNEGDGYTMELFWYEAYPSSSTYNIIYNLYYSTEKENIFSDGVKYAILPSVDNSIKLTDFTPGEVYYWAVRASQYNPAWYNPDLLPQYTAALKTYPETVLAANISDTDVVIPILDNIENFPNYGILTVGREYIRYTSKDIPNSTLIASERGFLGTTPRLHTTDGYDGYKQMSPIVSFFKGLEEQNGNVLQRECTFEEPYYAFNNSLGFKDKADLITSTEDLKFVDEERINFRPYDYAGWHRTDPKLLFQGKCLDSYLGGEHFCADSDLGVGRQIRNISISEQADRHQEMLLEQIGTGEEVILIRRLWEGKPCRCYTPNSEYPQPRCQICLGTGIVGGYTIFHNPRRSDGRIMVRFGPSTEDLKREEGGIENSITFDCWTTAAPILNDSDILIRFNEDGTEEWRYEILDLIRNKLLYGESGRQQFKAQRIRKTSPAYQIKAIKTKGEFPLKITTLVGNMKGPNGTFIPHTHDIVVNENISDVSQINTMTSVSAGHSHEVRNGVIIESLLHQHLIVV